MKKIFLIPLVFFIFTSCGENSGKKSQTPTSEKKSEETLSSKIVLNSNDTMKFDQNMLLVKAGKTITLTLNHTGKFGKRGMGHNFVLLKADVDVSDFAQRAASAMKLNISLKEMKLLHIPNYLVEVIATQLHLKLQKKESTPLSVHFRVIGN